MSGIHLRCCENQPDLEIEYEIGTTYLVCSACAGKKHFARGIKSKNKIGKNSQTTQDEKASPYKRR